MSDLSQILVAVGILLAIVAFLIWYFGGFGGGASEGGPQHSDISISIGLRVAVLFCYAMEGIANPATPCTSPRSFDFLLANSQAYYTESHTCFFETFNAMAELVKGEIRTDPAKKFLSFASVLNGNAEVSEAFSEVVEDLAVHRTEYFLKAAVTLDKRPANALATILRNPNFVEKSEVQKRFSLYSGNPKFKKFIDKTR